MKTREMKKITDHFDRYFEQSDCMVLHPIINTELHVDILLYKPTEKFPFWKLVTMGVSDYKMPKIRNTLGRFNEFIMFVDQDIDLNNKETLVWYADKLGLVSTYAYHNKTHVTFGHSIEWKNEDPDDEMIAAFIELPQVIEDVGILRCKLGIFKTVVCLQVVLLNQVDLEKIMDIGPRAFGDYLYPEEYDKKQHFLSEKHRSEKF